MIKRESLRYDGVAYRATLVCWCGAARRFSISAPKGKVGKPNAEVFERDLAARIEKSGWLDGWGTRAEWDMCPKCNAARQS